MEGDHWHPGRTPCVPVVFQPLQSDVTDAVPSAITRPTLIIWHMRTCMACKHAADFFAKLQRFPGEFQVIKVEASRAYIQRFPHIQTLPLFDLVLPSPGKTSPYGADTDLKTVRNHERHLLASTFPQAMGQ